MKMRPLYTLEEKQALLDKYGEIYDRVQSRKHKNFIIEAMLRVIDCPYVVENE